MPGLHPNRMREPDRRADPVVEDALKRGFMDSGTAYEIPGFPTHDAAAEGMRCLHRSAKRMNVGMAAWVCDDQGEQCWQKGRPVSEYCYDPQGVHRVHFRIWSKNSARAHVLEQSGGDPANLRYNPWERKQKTRVSDDGSLGPDPRPGYPPQGRVPLSVLREIEDRERGY